MQIFDRVFNGGKSTTLATLLDRINRTRPCHMVTIEDPIEYLHQTRKALVNQRQVGTDAPGFYEALVASLRQDPDVILVGEIRDLNTIRTAIVAAETGHLVFTTVHAGDCVGADRAAGGGLSRRRARRHPAAVGAGAAGDRRPAPGGRRRHRPTSGTRPSRPAATATERPVGPLCRRRVAVVTSEVLMVNPAVANLIATAKSNQIYLGHGDRAARRACRPSSRTWPASGSRGQISEATAMAMARNPGVAARPRRADSAPGRPRHLQTTRGS